MDIKYFFRLFRGRVKYGCDLNTFEDLKAGDCVRSPARKRRLNLVMTSIDAATSYGGAATIYTFFQKLNEALGCEVRVVVLDGSAQESNAIGVFQDYRIGLPDQETNCPATIVGIPETEGKRPSLMVREEDVFVTTYWTTMFITKAFQLFQDQAYGHHPKLIYFIQDYEPGFYEWGSEYLLAESTYRIPDTIAVYNSENLFRYFTLLDYRFADQMWFEPKLNANLKEYLLSAWERNELPERRNRVIVYGRPRIWRNCFSLVVASLKAAIETDESLRDWEFLSLGAAHKDIDLGHGARLICRGKLTLVEYARTLLETKAGISLMCSPHPSYPPLEMAAFGVNTVTNQFCRKDLSSFSDNIISVSTGCAEEVAAALISATRRESHMMDPEDPYLRDEDQFSEIIPRLVKHFD